ncbi:hypothetical protein OHA37_21680 [Streptomyces sp. NBC_00335]|uniref:hypothetical protein n=1 Tax=unclassified Streptomyces TaxID=2593676 RepID=UPI0022524EFB|nr:MULTISPECIES: hypothetical protein [unclassified Streptomyces]MCX5406473.1 hypothetical protein [Streptomyces sp. NBC_00086]
MTSAVVIAAAALGGLAVPGVAHAADDGCYQGMYTTREGAIVIKNVYTRPDVTVHVRDKKTGLRVAAVDKFKDLPWEESDDMFATDVISDPLKLPELGIYTLEVDTAAGTTVCGDLDYRLRSEMTKPTAGKVSLDNLKTTVSADLTGFDPRTQTSSPLANAKVSLAGEGVSQEATTDAQGHLAAPYTYRGTEAFTNVRLGVAQTPQMDAVETWLTVGTVRQKAEIVLDPESRKIRALYGSTAKITGQAVWIAADGTRKPVPESTRLSADLTGVPLTKADGRFERQVRITSTGTSTSWEGWRATPWLEAAEGRTQVELVSSTLIRTFRATMDSARQVTLTGDLHLRPVVENKSANVEVQYSADGKTNWTTRKTFTAKFDTGSMKQTVPGEADGYWRMRYAGESLIQGYVTPAVRLTRKVTAFKTFDAAPEPVRKGQTFAIKGTLQHGTPAVAYGAQTVLFYFQPAGTRGFLYQGSAKTAADGTFVRKFTADRTGTWIARYRDADGKHFNAESRRDDLQVNP